MFIGKTDDEAETPVLWPPDGKRRLIGKDAALGKLEGKKKWRQQRMRWVDGITDWMDMNLSQVQDMLKDRDLVLLRIMGSQAEMTE